MATVVDRVWDPLLGIYLNVMARECGVCGFEKRGFYCLGCSRWCCLGCKRGSSNWEPNRHWCFDCATHEGNPRLKVSGKDLGKPIDSARRTR